MERDRASQGAAVGQESAQTAATPGRSTLVQQRGPQKGAAGAPKAKQGSAAAEEQPRWSQLKAYGGSGGKPLPDRQRAQFQQSLGRDLSKVRVHDDDAAAASADEQGARAYAHEDNIVFNKGEYDPDNPEKDQLLAHEVAHTQQQSGAASNDAPDKTTPGDSVEKNADKAAGAMVQGAPTSVAAAPAAIARKAKGEPDAPAGGDGGDDGGLAATPPPPSGGGAPAPTAADGKGDPAKDGIGKEAGGGDFSVQLIGTNEVVKPDVAPNVKGHDLEGGKAELAGIGQKLPQSGAEGVGAEGIKIDAPAGPAPHAGGGGDAPVPKELAEQIKGAQEETKSAVAEAQGESAAYKAEIKEKRDRFEDEQHATMLESLKTMSSADKRSTLKDMGYDEKALKKIKDSELDGIISGKMETEQRKNKIMGMDPDELKKLSPAQKIQFLVDLGIDRGDLDKAGQGKACKLFDDVMAVAHVPGEHECKIKISGGFLGIGKKDWVVNVKVDLDGNATMDVKKEGGWLSKLWGWVKAALPIILVCLAPLTGGASLIVLAVYQAAMAIKNGDWLGAIVGAATALVGLGAFTAAGAFAKVADVAKKVKDVATAAQASLAAAKAKNAGSLLAALAGGAGAFAGFAANSADKFAKTMQSWSDKLKKWSNIVGGGEKVVAGIKSGDPLGAVSGAFDTAAAVVGPTGKGAKNIERAQAITGFVASGKRALSASPPDYGAVASAAMGIANQLKQDRRLEDAGRIVNAANRLTQAWKNKDANPAGLADAALDLATSIQVAKYDADHPAEKDADGKDKPDQSREAVLDRYSQAQRVVRAAGSAIQAVMHKPRPNYIAALDAGSQLVAELTADKRIDAAAAVTARLNAYTQAVNSKNDQAILEAAIAFGQSVDGLRDSINDARAKAKKDAEAQMQPGDKLPEADAGEMPRFDTSIEVTADAPVVPLIGPGIVTELDPSELAGAGGAGPTRGRPGGANPTTPGSRDPQGPQQPSEPKIGAAPGEPATPTAPAKPREVPADVSHIMDIIKIAADVAKLGGFTIGKALVDQWEASVKEFTDAKEDPKTTSEVYEAKLKTLRFIKSSGKFIDVVSKELGKYEQQLNGEAGDLKGAAMAFGRARRNLDRFVRVAELPLAILQASDNVIILCGYKADGSGAPSSMLERAQAAEKLVVEGSQLPGELAWLGRVGARLAGKLGAESAVTAINTVKRAINAYGDDVARVVMKRVTPILEKAAARETPAIITRLGESFAAEVVKWGAGELARAASNDLIKAAFGQLATRLGFAARVTCSAPAAIAFEVAELEAHMAAEMYREAYKSISHFLSARAFGQTIDQWKNAIRSQSLSTERAADAFFNWAFGTFLSGALYEVRGGWLPYTWSNLPARALVGSQLSSYNGSTNPVQLLTKIDPADLKTMIVAPALQQLMLDYLDREYQRIFHEAP